MLLEVMLVAVGGSIDIYASGEQKIANIYEYVKYNSCCLYHRGFAFQTGNPGKALQVYKNVNLSTEIQRSLVRRTGMHSPFYKV